MFWSMIVKVVCVAMTCYFADRSINSASSMSVETD